MESGGLFSMEYMVRPECVEGYGQEWKTLTKDWQENSTWLNVRGLWVEEEPGQSPSLIAVEVDAFKIAV